MTKITTSTVLALVLLGTSAYAAKSNQQATTNGAPFQALTELIEANEARITDNANLISANSLAIAANASSISDLEAQAALTADALSALEARVSTNEIDIATAMDALATANVNIDALSSQINSLTISVSASINFLTDEVNTIKTTVAGLSASLSTLRADMVDAVAQLDAAISANSGDIAILSAVVTSMDAKLTLANADILTLTGRVSAAEVSIDSQSDALLAIDAQMGALDVRLTALEANATTSREFTIYGTGGLDITLEGFRDQIASLNYKNGEFLYIKGVNSLGTYELCTSNANVTSILEAFVNNTSYYWSEDNPTNIWMKAPNDSTWSSLSMVIGHSLTNNGILKLVASSGHSSLLFNVNPDNYDGTFLNGYEIQVNSWDRYHNNSITYRVGSTSLEACGIDISGI